MTDKERLRVACGVRAINARLEIIVAEMDSALRQREQAYRMADAFLNIFDDLARERYALTRTLWKAEQRLAEETVRDTESENRKVAA